jgi:hypothetical protein
VLAAALRAPKDLLHRAIKTHIDAILTLCTVSWASDARGDPTNYVLVDQEIHNISVHIRISLVKYPTSHLESNRRGK